jgi:hypothetical protein
MPSAIMLEAVTGAAYEKAAFRAGGQAGEPRSRKYFIACPAEREFAAATRKGESRTCSKNPDRRRMEIDDVQSLALA